MNINVLKRFIVICAITTVVVFTAFTIYQEFAQEAPGDYYTRQGDIRLGEDKLDQAMESFNKALEEMPNHRGALMGRALVYIKAKKPAEAIAELTYLIDYLKKTLEKDDSTGWGTLAAAYANRGIMHDLGGRYETALADYVSALRTDEGAVSGPRLFDKIIYGTPRPSTIRKRATYIEQQLALPPEKRLMRVPEIDAKQRMHKP